MAVVSGYSMHLYCDAGGDPFGAKCPNRPFAGEATTEEIYSENKKDCIKRAMKKGWSFRNDYKITYCPNCTRDYRKT